MIKKILILLLLFLPIVAFGAIELEQTYPEFSGAQSVKTIIEEPTLQNIIKYYTNWAIIIAILAAIFALIIGGLQYITSAGKTQATSQAKSRIGKAFLGLAILVVSYTILQIIDPNLNIRRVVKVSVQSGMVMFTQDGFNLLSNGQELQDVFDSGQAMVLPKRTNDSIGIIELGGFKAETNANIDKVNFKGFNLYAIGFFGKDKESFRFITYSDSDFGVVAGKKRYVSQGEIDEYESVVSPSVEMGSDPGVSVIVLNPDGFFKTKVSYIKADKTEESDLVLHPPLSWEQQGIGPGIYIYSQEADQGYLVPGEHHNIYQDMTELEIRKTGKDGKEHDYLAIFYDKAGFNGDFRMFFEKNEDFYLAEVLKKPGFGTGWFFNQMPVDLVALKQSPSIYNGTEYPLGSAKMVAGNVTESDFSDPNRQRIALLDQDRYGKLSTISSAKVFELGSESLCEKVVLCQSVGDGTAEGGGFCLAFTDKGKEVRGRYNTYNLPMPWYYPVNIPARITDMVRKDSLNSKKETASFKNNILSIEIEGKCVVVLFQNYVKDSVTCDNNSTKCWKTGGPGERSGIFVSTDSDLTNDPVGKCSGGAVGIYNQDIVSCVSAIAVFPYIR